LRLEIATALDAYGTVEASKIQYGFSLVTDAVNIIAFPGLATPILSLTVSS